MESLIDRKLQKEKLLLIISTLKIRAIQTNRQGKFNGDTSGNIKCNPYVKNYHYHHPLTLITKEVKKKRLFMSGTKI